MKSVLVFTLAVLKEAGERCCVDTARDAATLRSRFEHEGVAYLAITLPRFCKDLERALADGVVSSDAFAGFQRSRGLPKFLGGFLRKMFDSHGFIRPDVDWRVIRDTRQVLLLHSKLELPVSPRRIAAAFDSYIQTDVGIQDALPAKLLTGFRASRDALLGGFLSHVEKELVFDQFSPKHGTGASSNRLGVNRRWAENVWTQRLQGVFPYWEALCINWRDASESDVEILATEQEPPVRVVAVPKTLKGPRIIAMEPSWMMFVQQGILSAMTAALPLYPSVNRILGWLDQEPNRQLSQHGSIDGSYATIDLSEASDRVSLQLAELIFEKHPALLSMVLASRSTSSDVGGKVIELRKFASMGSAMCFPIESMVFATILLMAQSTNSRGGVPTRDPYEVLKDPMRVFGDDIIVAQDAAQQVCNLLEAFGLKVNESKTFTTGLFRESCGADWYGGHDVSVYRYRHTLPVSRDPENWASAIAFHNHAFSRGWYAVAEVVESSLKRLRSLPYSLPGFEGSALYSFDKEHTRWNESLMRFDQRVLVFKERKPVDPLDGYGALRKVFRVERVEPLDSTHLVREGRSQCVGMITGWQARDT